MPQDQQSASPPARDRADRGLVATLGVQQAALAIPGIALIPVIVARAGGASEDYVTWAVVAALLASGIATLLQASRSSRIGTGYALLAGPSVAFITVCILALEAGGPGMLGMLLVLSAIVQVALSPRIAAVQRIVTPTLLGTGLVLAAVDAMPPMFGMVRSAEALGTPANLASAAATLGAFAFVALRGVGAWRLRASVISVGVGCAVAAGFGMIDFSPVREAAWFGIPIANWPSWGHQIGPDFWRLLPLFVFVATITAVDTIRDATAIQRVSSSRERAADYRAVQGSVAAIGVGNMLCGLLGTVPTATYSSSAAYVERTGVATRRVSAYAAMLVMAVAVVPKFVAAFTIVPVAVAGALGLALLALLAVLGLRIVIRDGMGYRKAIILGLSLWISIGAQQGLFDAEALGTEWALFTANGFIPGVCVAVLLTVLLEVANLHTRRVESSLDIQTLPRINAFIDALAQERRWEEAMADRVRAVAEEGMLALADRTEPGSDKQSMTLVVRSYEAGAELEFLVGRTEGNLEDQIADIAHTDAPVERELSLRLLRHLATSVSHKQFHNTDILTVRVDDPSA